MGQTQKERQQYSVLSPFCRRRIGMRGPLFFPLSFPYSYIYILPSRLPNMKEGNLDPASISFPRACILSPLLPGTHTHVSFISILFYPCFHSLMSVFLLKQRQKSLVLLKEYTRRGRMRKALDAFAFFSDAAAFSFLPPPPARLSSLCINFLRRDPKKGEAAVARRKRHRLSSLALFPVWNRTI